MTEQKFAVNGAVKSFSHPEPMDPNGCRAQVPDGVIPDQFGTWTLGRNGWCPGMDVKPIALDTTTAIFQGKNVIGFDVDYQGKAYDPNLLPIPAANAILPNINHVSYLVFWGDPNTEVRLAGDVQPISPAAGGLAPAPQTSSSPFSQSRGAGCQACGPSLTPYALAAVVLLLGRRAQRRSA